MGDFPCKTVYLYTGILRCPEDSHVLLRRAAAHCRAALGLPPGDLRLARGMAGKPYFPLAPDLHFSLSHSGADWVCALSGQPLGLDLQQPRPVDAAALARRFFHMDEAAYLQAHPEDFFRVWTAKESYVKYTGRGIAGQFASFSVVENGVLCRDMAGVSFRFLPASGESLLCLCCQDPSDVRPALALPEE